jgi:hypothetical protein
VSIYINTKAREEYKIKRNIFVNPKLKYVTANSGHALLSFGPLNLVKIMCCMREAVGGFRRRGG